MNRILVIIALLSLSTIQKASATQPYLNKDSIDFWHVFHNGLKIKALNQFTKNQMAFQLNKIKSTDVLTIKYFSDAPCKNCKTTLIVKDTNDKTIIKSEGRGTLEPRDIRLQSLVTSKQKYFQLFFIEDTPRAIAKSVRVLEIRLQ